VIYEIGQAERELGSPMPSELRSFYERHNGYFSESGQWWVVWPLERLGEENRRARSLGLSEALIAFGDDGTGSPFCVRRGDDSGEVLRWSWIDGEVERSEGTFPEFASAWLSEP
jgi:hypothetical protein